MTTKIPVCSKCKNIVDFKRFSEMSIEQALQEISEISDDYERLKEKERLRNYVIHLRCPKCQKIDIVFLDKAKDWKCFCETNPPHKIYHGSDGPLEVVPDAS